MFAVVSGLVAVLYGLAAHAGESETDSLLAGFREGPQAGRPQVWWHWMNGNVNLDGAKLDLAWMQRIGIGGIHTFTGGGLGEPHVVEPPVDFLGEQWRATFRATTRLARAAGMEVTIAGSPGWSETGGIWVAPEDAMKKYVWSETRVTGGEKLGPIPAPPPPPTEALSWGAGGHNPPPPQRHAEPQSRSLVAASPTTAAAV